jgi:hypothetical protein
VWLIAFSVVSPLPGLFVCAPDTHRLRGGLQIYRPMRGEETTNAKRGNNKDNAKKKQRHCKGAMLDFFVVCL